MPEMPIQTPWTHSIRVRRQEIFAIFDILFLIWNRRYIILKIFLIINYLIIIKNNRILIN